MSFRWRLLDAERLGNHLDTRPHRVDDHPDLLAHIVVMVNQVARRVRPPALARQLKHGYLIDEDSLAVLHHEHPHTLKDQGPHQVGPAVQPHPCPRSAPIIQKGDRAKLAAHIRAQIHRPKLQAGSRAAHASAARHETAPRTHARAAKGCVLSGP